MQEHKQIAPEALTENTFTLLERDWALLGVAAGGKTNAMTISWGGMGVLWKKKVVFVFVRHSRYSFELMEAADSFSLSWLEDPGHKLLGYMGKASGRDQDKIAQSGLTCTLQAGAPVFDQARLTMVCRKLYAQDQQQELFVDPNIVDACYGDRDWHRMYVGEIINIFEAGC